MLIDLHTHSNASDGTDAPAGVVAAAGRAGLDVVALTDHDTTAGWAEASAAASPIGVAVVLGTEVSARARGVSVHLLSYLQDPAHPALVAELDHTREARLDRARAMVARLGKDFGLTWADVVAQTQPGTTVGRPHIADALVVLGTEVSAWARGVSVHLLSYLQDPDHPALIAELNRTRVARLDRARAMVERLGKDFGLTWADVVAQTQPDTTVGRPHIADALVALGAIPDRSAAFATLLLPRSKYYVPHYAPDVLDAIAAVRASGGVPVFAHPGADGRGRVVPDDVIEAMAGAGLAGLEVHHRDHSPAQVARLSALAERLGLLSTGSSDYHGAGKPNLIGENVTDPAVLAAIEEQGATRVVRP